MKIRSATTICRGREVFYTNKFNAWLSAHDVIAQITKQSKLLQKAYVTVRIRRRIPRRQFSTCF